MLQSYFLHACTYTYAFYKYIGIYVCLSIYLSIYLHRHTYIAIELVILVPSVAQFSFSTPTSRSMMADCGWQ